MQVSLNEFVVTFH